MTISAAIIANQAKPIPILKPVKMYVNGEGIRILRKYSRSYALTKKLIRRY
jgi:hypothetical protein